MDPAGGTVDHETAAGRGRGKAVGRNTIA
jgi:hypothetical protein